MFKVMKYLVDVECSNLKKMNVILRQFYIRVELFISLLMVQSLKNLDPFSGLENLQIQSPQIWRLYAFIQVL